MCFFFLCGQRQDFILDLVHSMIDMSVHVIHDACTNPSNTIINRVELSRSLGNISMDTTPEAKPESGRKSARAKSPRLVRSGKNAPPPPTWTAKPSPGSGDGLDTPPSRRISRPRAKVTPPPTPAWTGTPDKAVPRSPSVSTPQPVVPEAVNEEDAAKEQEKKRKQTEEERKRKHAEAERQKKREAEEEERRRKQTQAEKSSSTTQGSAVEPEITVEDDPDSDTEPFPGKVRQTFSHELLCDAGACRFFQKGTRGGRIQKFTLKLTILDAG